MEIKIKYFGKLTDIAGCDTERILVETEYTLEKLLNEIHCKYMPIKGVIQFIFLNGKKVSQNQIVLNSGDEITLMPLFSGG